MSHQGLVRLRTERTWCGCNRQGRTGVAVIAIHWAGADPCVVLRREMEIGQYRSAPAGNQIRVLAAGRKIGRTAALDAKMAERDEPLHPVRDLSSVPAHPATVDFQRARFTMDHHRPFAAAFRAIRNTIPGTHWHSSDETPPDRSCSPSAPGLIIYISKYDTNRLWGNMRSPACSGLPPAPLSDHVVNFGQTSCIDKSTCVYYLPGGTDKTDSICRRSRSRWRDDSGS